MNTSLHQLVLWFVATFSHLSLKNDKVLEQRSKLGWLLVPLVPALGKLRQEDCFKLKAGLGCRERHCLK